MKKLEVLFDWKKRDRPLFVFIYEALMGESSYCYTEDSSTLQFLCFDHLEVKKITLKMSFCNSV